MFITSLVQARPELKSLEKVIRRTSDAITFAFARRRKLLLCGNGGSAADAEHISTEFLKGFMSKRPLSKARKADIVRRYGKQGRFVADRLQEGYAALPLVCFSSLITAFANDVAPELAFAQMVNATGEKGDVFFGISTSGEADNVIYAAMTAKARGLKTVALTGKGGGRLGKMCDIVIIAPGEDTPGVQEYHLPIYHAICKDVEARLTKTKR